MGWIVRVELVTAGAASSMVPEPMVPELQLAESLLWDLHTIGIAEVDPDPAAGVRTLIAGFETEAEARAAAEALLRPPPTGAGARCASAEPVDPGAWFDEHRTGALDVGGERRSFDVGPAFGHGGHPTTVLALALLPDAIGSGATVLDFGTGTGVLALAAAALGAEQIVAVDNDPDALAVARANLAAGAGESETRVLDRLPPPARSVGAGSTVPGSGTSWSSFDVIAANVLLPVHREHGPALVQRLKPGGSVVVTGVLVEQQATVLEAYAPLRPVAHLTDGDWLGLRLGATGE